jgi:hypothetical protein
VPLAVVEYLAAQLEIAGPSCAKSSATRGQTDLEHAWEIKDVVGLPAFLTVQPEPEA